MSSRFTRMTFLAAAASLLLSGPQAMAIDKGPSCAELENSLMPAPDWYAERCLAGAAVIDYSQYKETEGLVPGDIAFYKNNFPAPQNVKTAPLATLTFTTIGPNAQPLFAMTFNPSATILYAIDNTTRQLGTINQTTGAFTSIGVVTGPAGGATVTGLAFDSTAPPTSAYAVYTDGVTANLFRVDVATAVGTLVAPIAGFALVIDIVVDTTGQMYGHDIGADVLIRINKATGATVTVGPTGLAANFAQGMMYDPSDDTIYGCAFVTSPAQQGELVTFSKTTGLATVVAGPVPDEMECGVKRGVGGPCTAPIFGGITSATNGGTASCAVNLAWNAAIACPGTTVKYNVYRSTTPATPPTAATLLQSCVTGLTYTDTTATSGTRYYYKVRAEDNTTTGTGACNNGVQDGNLTEASAVATGPSTTTTDNVESGPANWDTTGGIGTNVWAIVTTRANSPVSSWFVADPAVVTDQRLRKVAAVAFPAAGGQFSFFHTYTTELTYDGHVLEYSLDGGTTWSDILAAQGTVPANPNRFTMNGYNQTISTAFQSPIAGRRAWSGNQAAFQEVRVNMADFANRSVTIRFRFASDNSVAATGVWIDDISFSLASSCSTVPAQAAAPAALAVDTAGNGVYQPNETVIVAPTWRNTGSAAITLTGALTNHTGPAGPVYTIPDGAATYGTIAVGATASCSTGGNCYSVANTTATRPITHWDSTALETVTPTGATKTWTLHIGDSFTDVPPSSGFYRFIETILHKNVTGGCTATTYCPTASTTREQMAVFVLVAKEPAGFVPPACVAGSERFTDVPATSPFCKWVEELARRGVVGGCTPTTYCPTAPATREQMAVFVLRTLDPALNPPACGTPVFADVPASSPFCKWIEERVRRGVVAGCGGGNYCPTAPVTREQMSVFLAVTFSLVLYGL